MFRKLDALFHSLPFYAQVAVVTTIGVGVIKLTKAFYGPAQGEAMIYRVPPGPDITRAMESIMQGIKNAQGDNPTKLPDIPGLDSI